MLSTGDEQTKKFEGYHASHATRVTACNFHLTYKGMESGVCFTFLEYMFVSCMYACVCCETNAGCAGTSRDHIPFNSFPTYHCPWRMFLVSQDISSRIIDLNETRIVRALVRLFVLGLSKNRPWCVFRPLGGNRIGNRQTSVTTCPGPCSVMWSLESGNGGNRTPRCETGVAVGLSFSQKRRNVLRLSLTALCSHREVRVCEFVRSEMFNRSYQLSEGFQKASRFIGNWMEIGIGPEEFWIIMESWCSLVIGVPICSRLKIKKCVAPAVVWPG